MTFRARLVRAARGGAISCALLASCQPRPESARDRLLADIASDWRGAGMLAGQARSVCDSLVIATPVPRCGTVAPVTPSQLDAYAALAAATTSAAPASRTADAVHVLARLDVAVNPDDAATLTRAVAVLADAVRRPDHTTDMLIDHSAIALQHFAVTHEVVDLVSAIESATSAVERDPTRTEAAWNRAVALTWAGMRGVARAAWAQYDSLAAAGGASRRPVVVDPAVDSVSERLALEGRWREATREYAWNVALPQFAAALRGGGAAAVVATGAVLDSLAVLCERDGLDGDVAALRDALRAAAQRGDETQLRLLEHTLGRYLWSRSGAGRQSPAVASATIDALLRQPGVPPSMRRWLRMQQANQHLIMGRSEAAIALFGELRRDPSATAVLHRLRAASGAAMTLASLGRTAESVTELEGVERECVRLRLEDCRLAMPAMVALYGAVLGDVATTEAAASRAVAALAPATLTQWHFSSAFLLRQVAELHQAPRAAESFDQEAVAVALRLGRADLATAVTTERVRAALQHGDWERATRLVRELRERWVPRQTSEDQQWSAVNLLQFDAELGGRRDPAAGIALLDSALRLTAADVNDARRTPLQQVRARLTLAAGDTVAALAGMDELMLRLRDRGRGRATVFDAARRARVLESLSQSAALALRARRDWPRALRALSGEPFAELPTTACCSTGASTAMAVRMVGDSVWIWTVTRAGVRLRVSALSTRAVRAAVALDTAALATLYESVLGGSLPLRDGATLCLDTRGLLSQVPWSALMDRRRGRYLVETVPLLRVRDALDGCHPPAMPAVGVSAAQLAVVQAAPAAGPRALPATSREVTVLRTLWGASARVIPARSGSGATLRAMSEAALVHFAGHAIVNRDRPADSYLLLDAGADSMITGAAIAARRLARAPVVILAACDAGGGTEGPFGGFDSLAGAFLGAGASSVIAASWAVDDAPTGMLMQLVHGALHAGASPPDALRHAQLQALASTDPALRTPRVWAAFQIMGSGGGRRHE